MAQDQYSLFKPSDSMRDLQLLEEIERNPRISQRELSHKFGIALGLTNACIKRMARRGLIRLKGIPPRRIAYYLTPRGFTEKTKLTLSFFSYNIHHYAEMKKQISKKLIEMQSSGVKRVAFCGLSDEMEVAYILLHGTGMELVAIMDPSKDWIDRMIFGLRVKHPKEIKNVEADALLVTSLSNKLQIEKELRKAKTKMVIYSIS